MVAVTEPPPFIAGRSERPPAPPTRSGSVSPDERRRETALGFAVQTFQSAQGLDTSHTSSILERAKIFEDYIAGG
jgi:hypothetical protein